MFNPIPQVDHFSRAKALIAEGEKAQVIDTQEKAEAATAWVGQAKTTIEVLDAERLAAGKPHRDAIANINSEYAPSLEPLKAHESRVRALLKGWAVLIMRRQQAEAERQRQDTERRATEEAARLESEAAALRKEAEEALAAGRAAVATKMYREANQKEAQAETAIEHAIETPQAAPVREIAPIHSVAGTTFAQKDWDWVIMDINLVPDQYVIKTANKAALNAAVKKNGVRAIPGVQITETAKLQTRR
mgnify:FL=1